MIAVTDGSKNHRHWVDGRSQIRILFNPQVSEKLRIALSTHL